jgi:hypothetical protein
VGYPAGGALQGVLRLAFIMPLVHARINVLKCPWGVGRFCALTLNELQLLLYFRGVVYM